MANKFFTPGEQRAARVDALFARIAPRYDLINDLQSFGLHRHWKRRLLGLARVQPGERVLDLCCGTGDVTLAFAARGARSCGLDFNAPMLAVAARRAAARPPGTGHPPRWVRGDALRLPFADAQFDVVAISYGLRNLADFAGGLREMLRVTRPGGRLLVLDFGKPDHALWRGLYFAYLRTFVPLLGKIFCGDAATHGYILESLKNYPGQRAVAARLEALGCVNGKLIHLLGGMMSLNYAEKPGRSV